MTASDELRAQIIAVMADGVPRPIFAIAVRLALGASAPPDSDMDAMVDAGMALDTDWDAFYDVVEKMLDAGELFPDAYIKIEGENNLVLRAPRAGDPSVGEKLRALWAAQEKP